VAGHIAERGSNTTRKSLFGLVGQQQHASGPQVGAEYKVVWLQCDCLMFTASPEELYTTDVGASVCLIARYPVLHHILQ
jgi:hypothetical protein